MRETDRDREREGREKVSYCQNTSRSVTACRSEVVPLFRGEEIEKSRWLRLQELVSFLNIFYFLVLGTFGYWLLNQNEGKIRETVSKIAEDFKLV
jgi:hypothetical protein